MSILNLMDLTMEALVEVMKFLWYIIEGVYKAVIPPRLRDQPKPIKGEVILITQAGKVIDLPIQSTEYT